MIPFDRAWPYETAGGQVYVTTCPFCRSSNVLLPLKTDELPAIKNGMKRRVVFPCCHGMLHIVEADNDYLLTDRTLKRE
jgi:hypothetical protein